MLYPVRINTNKDSLFLTVKNILDSLRDDVYGKDERFRIKFAIHTEKRD